MGEFRKPCHISKVGDETSCVGEGGAALRQKSRLIREKTLDLLVAARSIYI